MSTRTDAVAGLTTLRTEAQSLVTAYVAQVALLATGRTEGMAAIDPQAVFPVAGNTQEAERNRQHVHAAANMIQDGLSVRQFQEDVAAMLAQLGLADIVADRELAIRANLRQRDADNFITKWTARIETHVPA